MNQQRLDRDLQTVVSRLHPLGSVAAVETLPWAIGGQWPFADEVEAIQVYESREIAFATRELLRERVNRLSAALDRMKKGEYGVCIECGEPISPARLRAAPEAQTCFRCQDRLERFGRPRPMVRGHGVRRQRNASAG